MFGALNNFLTGVGAAKDAFFNYVTMLLHGDGTNGAQNNTFLDSSTNNFTITRNGNTTQGTFSPYGSNWSNYFDGSSYLTFGATSTSGQFTAEAWVYLTSFSSSPMVIAYGNGTTTYNDQLIRVNGSGFQTFYTPGIGTITGSVQINLNTWTHLAVCRNASNTIDLYTNGVLSGSNSSASGTVYLGGAIGTVYYNSAYPNKLSGYVSNARIVNGSALYTTNFTPSTTPLTAVSGTILLTCQSNRFIDNSASPLTISLGGTPSVQRFNPFGTSTAYSTTAIGGSGYFDGSGDYLSVPDNAALDLSTGDFTIECWAYPLTGISDLDGLISKRNQSTFSGSDWRIAYRTASTAFGIATGSNTTDRLTPAIKLNCWNHIAFVRSSGTLKCYANGVLGDSLAWTENLDNAESLLVGLNVAGYDFPGYITDVRINKGTAIYTGAFTPPSLAPLATSGASSAACYPSTTNVNTSFAASTTSLLTSMTNGAIYDNAMMNDLETVGNAQISTSVVKFGTGSLKFDGTGDYLAVRASPNFAFGTGDFTIECWLYVSSNPAQYTCIMSNWGGSDPAWLLDFSNGSGNIRFNDSSNVYLTSSSALPTGQWNYLAVTRSGTSLKMFFNGSQVASATNSTSFGSASSGLFVGAYYNNTYPLNGYIDDLRITKGYARTITTPTAAFPNIGPT